MITQQEARQLIDEINSGISAIGGKILELHERRGWEVLGYNSWHECVMNELNFQHSHVYRLLNYAKVERNLIESPIGDSIQLPQTESVARPLTSLPKDEQAPVWLEALEQSNGKPTAKDVKKAVETITIKKTHVVRNWYTVSDWQQLDDNIKQTLLSKKGTSTFNDTNENIEWARYSWNPVTGCLHNCAYCYARDIANRFYPQKFEPSFLPDRLTAPQNTKQKDLNSFDNHVDKIGHQNVFVCSMADLFGKWTPDDWIKAVLKQVKDNPQWTFLFLTKFPVRMAEFEYPSNTWLGTSVDYQWSVDRAEKAFTKIKASGYKGVCWLSCEPMMERLTFTNLDMFDWVVMGGASRSSQTKQHLPPFDDIVHLYNQARKHNCKVYQKTNLIPSMSDEQRIREYPCQTNN